MFSAAELIDALQARHRRRFPLHAERPFGEFPPTWRTWFLSMRERAGAVVGAPAADFIALLGERPPRPRPKASPPLTRWQALRRVGRQQWEPAPPDQRRGRRVAAVFSGVLHLFFALLLLWLGDVLGDQPPPPEEEGEAMLVEFIGEGTPTDDTGGAPAEGASPGTPTAQTSARTAPANVAQDTAPPDTAPSSEPDAAESSAQTEASTPTPAAPPTDVPTSDVPLPELQAPELVLTPPPPEPPPPPPVVVEPAPAPAPPTQAEQPLTVTQTPKPDNAFRLPPPSPPAPAPAVTPPKPEVREVAVVPPRQPVPEPAPRPEPTPPTPAPPRPTPPLPPAPTPPQPKPPTAPASKPAVPTPPAPVPPAPKPPEPKPPALPAPKPPEPKPPVAPAAAPAAPKPAPTSKPAPAPAAPKPVGPPASKPAPPAPAPPAPAPAGEGPVRVAPAGPAKPSPATTPGGAPKPSAGAGRPAATASSGVGPSPSPRPGAAPAQVRDDDWGASNRNVPGNATAGRSDGLFDNNGRVRLPGNGGQVGGGLPPGTVIEDFEKIDRMGTWLKRPPLDYTPTRFDKFWVPHENLLEEWVRRGIKKVAIPLPGSTKRILCTVSLLQAGGGCTIDDPNLQDQEATARPPPDVPFKPELQQDQGSLGKPALTPPGTP